MQHPIRFIVKPLGNKYIQERVVEGGKIITSTSIERAGDVNRVGVVVRVPRMYKGSIKEGYEVVLHHNVFRDVYNQAGDFRHSNKLIEDDNFLVDENSIFMYKGEGEGWNCNLDFCFIRPFKIEELGKIKNAPLEGTIAYSNVLPTGTHIGFTPESEYEFLIDDEILYKMSERDIAILYEEPEW